LILNPDHFTPIVQNHELVGWRYRGSPTTTPLESQVFLPEEVWHEKLSNPYNFWRGLSPLAPAELAMKTDHAASAYMRGFIENNADMGVIVRTNDNLDDTQKEQLLAALRNRKNGCGTADRPLLLWNSCEIVKPTVSSADLQFIENRKFSRSEICAALGVPEEIVSTTDHNKYDVMQGARLNFIENRVAPLCARLEAAERATVKALDPTAVGWFDLDSLPIMQQARRNRLAAAKTGFDMGVPFNDLNRLLDLGLPELPWGNTGYLPSTLKSIGSSSSSPSSSSSNSASASLAGPSAAGSPRPLDGRGVRGEGVPVKGSNGQSGADFEVQGSKFGPAVPTAPGSAGVSPAAAIAPPASNGAIPPPSANSRSVLNLAKDLHSLVVDKSPRPGPEL
jgi:hypothetical protein